MTELKAPKKRQVMQGEVVSHKMDKTAVVKVTSLKTHPKYKKHFTVSREYKVHDQNNEYHAGDVVDIEASRPLSREKRWKIVRKIK